MTHIYDLTDVQLSQPSVVTIGVFDGIHRGHQHLVSQLVEQAHSSGRLAVVLTFFPHPDIVLYGPEGRYYLTSPEERAAYLAGMGVDVVVTQRFDDDFRQILAADYVDQLLHHLKMAALWVGADFAMGYKREGNVAFLQAQGAQKGFDLRVVDLVAKNGDAISSTAIRQALQAGEIDRANDWLGRSYTLTGEVVQGDQRGRTIGFPTANLAVWEQQVIPANGVYAGWATLGDERFMAVTNVGIRPTFGLQTVTVETHLLDFDRDIYGQQLTISFDTRLRAEKKFNGVQELIAQIGSDAQAGRDYLAQSSLGSR